MDYRYGSSGPVYFTLQSGLTDDNKGNACQGPLLPTLMRPPLPGLQPAALGIKQFLPFPLEPASGVSLFPGFSTMDPVQKAVLHHTFGVPPSPKRKYISCGVCQLRFNSQSQALAHFKGTKHAKKLKALDAPKCKPKSLPVSRETSAKETPKSFSSAAACLSADRKDGGSGLAVLSVPLPLPLPLPLPPPPPQTPLSPSPTPLSSSSSSTSAMPLPCLPVSGSASGGGTRMDAASPSSGSGDGDGPGTGTVMAAAVLLATPRGVTAGGDAAEESMVLGGGGGGGGGELGEGDVVEGGGGGAEEGEKEGEEPVETEEEKARRLLYCSLCKVAVNSPSQLEAHNSGTKHKTMLEARTGTGSIKSFPRAGVKSKLPVAPTVATTGLQNKTFHCETCDVHVNSETQLKQHISSRRHKDRAAGKPAKPKYSPYTKPQRGQTKQPGKLSLDKELCQALQTRMMAPSHLAAVAAAAAAINSTLHPTLHRSTPAPSLFQTQSLPAALLRPAPGPVRTTHTPVLFAPY
ncbi:zinc finger protein 385B isoform X2 [Engraulis encrasicolus]|uniref:zinc finger protein 385B isoform X2 n=1 Tax=Engraulis encrasicolus TaxID=184585 RepID=UPI002FD3E657